ncbi:hypothetical protein FRC07_012076 [Ceratobasidium sp. 392]|nr:hypothetical protein FRC07_012076 [Ceratobasidium sp. 392]
MQAFAEEPWTHPPKIIYEPLPYLTKFPVDDPTLRKSKIPSVVWYDESGNAVSFGAEALRLETEVKAEDHRWKLARHFKLHLHPESWRQKHNLKVQPLPAGIPLEKIYTDFMVYLMKNTQEFFESRIIDGRKVWEDFYNDMIIVLVHPNGWTIKEQNFLRKAAIAAKYATEAKAHSRIHFVGEAEASVHFCMFHSGIFEGLRPNVNFIVCDAGSSIVDITTYNVKNVSPMLELEEQKASACVQAGAVFVDLECEKYLAGILNRIELDDDERNDYLRSGVKDFEGSAKKAFGLKSPDNEPVLEHLVDMGCRLQQPEYKIRRGKIVLSSDTIQTFFDPYVKEIVASIRQQMSGLNPEASSALIPPRATRVPYGVELNDPYDSQDPNHKGRTVHIHDAGYGYVTGKWSQIIGKGVTMSAAEAVRESYWRSYNTPHPRLNNFKIKLYAWTIDNEPPSGWLRDPYGNLNRGYEEICQVEADLSGMHQALKSRDGDYYYLDFTIALYFGGTELRAFMEWEQDGETRTGPASILPNMPAGVGH